ncbi:hypothetical protein SOVF_169670 isoform B, partial [Spinacia oleracea]
MDPWVYTYDSDVEEGEEFVPNTPPVPASPKTPSRPIVTASDDEVFGWASASSFSLLTPPPELVVPETPKHKRSTPLSEMIKRSRKKAGLLNNFGKKKIQVPFKEKDEEPRNKYFVPDSEEVEFPPGYVPVMSYMPQDFRGTLIRQQRERSERTKQAEIDALVKSGGSIHDRYALLWKQQMERRRQLAQLGSATGVYKTLVKYLVGVPQVLLDFIRQINDDDGPMEEQRHRYGPPLYSLTKMVLTIRLFIFLMWTRFDARKITEKELATLEQAVNTYTTEFERFIKFMGEVFANSPFFISADEVGSIDSRNDDYKEISIPAGKLHEVVLSVDSINSYIAWDFSLEQSKMKL